MMRFMLYFSQFTPFRGRIKKARPADEKVEEEKLIGKKKELENLTANG